VASVALLAVVIFSSGLYDDEFVDEYAYITQSYYADLFFGGHRDDPAWLDEFALDLQPLPKYFIGPGLHAANIRMPGPRDAARWYWNSHTRFGPPATLTVARVPFIATAVLGCLALFGCGFLLGGRWVGAIAALLLMINPLFRLHAHRSMSDVPCESFMIAALGLALWGVTRVWSGRGVAAWLALFAAAGVCSGLSIVCKLNGLLAPMIIAAWCGLGVLVPSLAGRAGKGFAAGAAVSIAMMLMTVVALNPTLTCRPQGKIRPDLAGRAALRPWGRFREMVKYRLESAAGQQRMDKFYPDVLRSPVDKAAVFAVQGFGRFSPFGPSESNSKVRYELRQDWGLVLWGPLVLLGILRAFRLGRRQLREVEPPTACALLVWTLVSWAVVAAYLPLAWDRYLLPIQAPNALLAAVGLSMLWDRSGQKAVAP
jgi:4-amino-4-deoxy-L-arabinose transferase-like glycosyltransferase